MPIPPANTLHNPHPPNIPIPSTSTLHHAACHINTRYEDVQCCVLFESTFKILFFTVDFLRFLHFVRQIYLFHKKHFFVVIAILYLLLLLFGGNNIM